MPHYPIIDGHNDIILDYAPAGKHALETFFQHNADERAIDLPRAQAGGLAGGMWAVFVSTPEIEAVVGTLDLSKPWIPDPLAVERATPMALAEVANIYRLAQMSQGRLRVVRTVAEIEDCMAQGIMFAVIHFEGAEPIDADLHALEVYYQAGLRSLGLVWSRPTLFAHGVPFMVNHSPDTGEGLTEAGRRLVKHCDELGILIDLSHLNEKGFWDVAGLSSKPLVATHSNAWAITPMTRNLTDAQLEAIAKSGGMAGVNFFPPFVHPQSQRDLAMPIEMMVAHIDYMVERMGIDHVGIGADFGSITMAESLKDATCYPALVEALAQRGYDDSALKKITHQNWLRVLRAIWGE
jgi:membrane dipeptidase